MLTGFLILLGWFAFVAFLVWTQRWKVSQERLVTSLSSGAIAGGIVWWIWSYVWPSVGDWFIDPVIHIKPMGVWVLVTLQAVGTFWQTWRR